MKKLSIISMVISTVFLIQGCGDFLLDSENINGREVVILEDEDVSSYPRFGTPTAIGGALTHT